MKRTGKPVFFIVTILIFALAYTTIFGISAKYGDRTDTYIRGASEIRLGTDIRGGVDVTFGPKDEGIKVSNKEMQNFSDVIERRLMSNNIMDYEVYEDVNNKQVIARFPWKSDETEFDANKAIEELGKTAMLEFRKGDEYDEEEDGEGNKVKIPKGEIVLTGNEVKSAESLALQNKETGATETVVELTLNDEGKEAFSKATAELFASKGKISIWLDDELISAPAVNGHISDGVASITSDSYKENPGEAQKLADLINSGALPFNIEVKSNSTIDATLGEKSLEVMVWGGLIAFGIISIFMVLYYRLPGFIAVISLIGQIAGSIAAVSGYFGFIQSFTLTLPGIAGMILSIGMGVDANVITAERIKEEVRAGKTIDGAISAGGENSFWAIFDGNVTVIIVSIILMASFGPPTSLWARILSPILSWFPVSTTGSIYAFGYTLFVGIIFNFIMGVTASRLMLKSITRFKAFRKPWLLGGERA